MTDNTATSANAATMPYKNPALPAEERIADLVGRMTLEEKVGQMMQLDARSGDLEDLIVNKHVGSILHTSPADLPRAVKMVNEQTRLNIPLVIGDDCIHGYSFWCTGRYPRCCASPATPAGAAWTRPLARTRC